ncbi:tRNA 2-thiouridine(34) synthase MnmA [Candidatus Woesearchaeota archaeon]|nr:MAG: tRNA 2-thiouridine(34) synthase MnmA [Candidatus Woesearchaeota archaeon]
MKRREKNNEKIIVGVSGGIDSTLALILLKKQGWKPIGVTLKLASWQNKQNKKTLKAARKICKKLKVPCYQYDAKKEFKKEVMDYFTSELKKGRTPNPCMICNRKIKFKKLIEFAKKKGIKYIATGHYAKIKYNPKTKKYELLKPKDTKKDQTYGLSLLPQKWLKHIKFPLANYTKEEVYKLAEKEGLTKASKQKQSQDLCFVSKKDLPKYLKQEIGIKPGWIKNEKGQKLTKHKGLHFYTIGQKKGIGLNERYYVKELKVRKNEIIATKNKKTINKKEMILQPINYISDEPPKKPIKAQAKVRYNQKLSKATIVPLNNKKAKAIFDKPIDSVAKGQFCVFYKGRKCLGGGTISNC